ncbi:hypothetical protein H2248_012009 [Termitomyces sp. 'cryptogamus']|nr:hypothetical protein H2248_012009 [Termitomyces sp. 'cryptogamus']
MDTTLSSSDDDYDPWCGGMRLYLPSPVDMTLSSGGDDDDSPWIGGMGPFLRSGDNDDDNAQLSDNARL